MSDMIKRLIFERVSENIITKPWMKACYRDYQTPTRFPSSSRRIMCANALCILTDQSQQKPMTLCSTPRTCRNTADNNQQERK